MAKAENRWAPLVYGRTKDVDFRLLAVPEGVSPMMKRWMRLHITGATVFPDDLRDGHRWSIFKNDEYCCFGLTCMASWVSTQRTIVEDRELYLFAGYAAKVDPQAYPDEPYHPPIPTLESLDEPPFQVFRTLYDYVDFLWDDDRTSMSTEEIEADIEKPFRVVPRIEQVLKKFGPAPEPNFEELNREADCLRILMHHDKINAGYWNEAANCSGYVSLAIRLPDRSSADLGPYLNATVVSATESHTHERNHAIDESIAISAGDADRIIAKAKAAKSERSRETSYEKNMVRFVDVVEDLAPSDGDWIDYDEVDYKMDDE